ncbi:MAG: transaldolase family protein [Bacteroidales bacterium]|nr:transaldolase family protein [Bacteroidales bacterium]
MDYIRRDLITSGELRRLIEGDGLRGMTSNPSIFGKAIAESNINDQNIHYLALNKKTSIEIYELISQQDVQNAADEFKTLYDQTQVIKPPINR